jgi:hypothetical protein
MAATLSGPTVIRVTACRSSDDSILANVPVRWPAGPSVRTAVTSRSCPASSRRSAKGVVHGEHQRAVAGDQPEQRGQAGADGTGIEVDAAGFLAQQGHAKRAALRRREPGEGLIRDAAQQVGQPDVGQPGIGGGRAAGEHVPAGLVGAGGGLGPQGGLADAWLALDGQDEPRPGRPGARRQPGLDLAKLGVPAQHVAGRRARSPDGHPLPPPSSSRES